MKKSTNRWLAYSGVGIQMVVTVLFCLWIGKMVESYFSIPYPFGQLVFILFGIFSSIINLIKIVK